MAKLKLEKATPWVDQSSNAHASEFESNHPCSTKFPARIAQYVNTKDEKMKYILRVESCKTMNIKKCKENADESQRMIHVHSTFKYSSKVAMEHVFSNMMTFVGSSIFCPLGWEKVAKNELDKIYGSKSIEEEAIERSMRRMYGPPQKVEGTDILL